MGTYEFSLSKRNYKMAAFLLHQATERYYTAVYLVYTHYRPKLHDLKRWGALVAGCDPAFLRVFPRATDFEDECFKLLKRAYVDARYKRDSFHITRKQLLYLADRVAELKKVARRLCRKKIAAMAEGR